VRLEALPLTLDYCRTRLAGPADADWARRRFRAACAELGTEVQLEEDRLVVTWPRPRGSTVGG
jgi:poly-gamma-glutamate synthesis protein (capsule biosynthesis protein)